MKKRFTFFAILILALGIGSQVFPQSSAFKSKHRQISAQPLNPQPLKSQINPNTQQNARLQNPSFSPKSIPSAVISLGALGLEQYRIDQNGQIFFVTVKIPGALPVDSRTGNQLEPYYQYLVALKDALGVKDPEHEFAMSRIDRDELGMTHVKMQQVYRGLPVWAAEAYLHTHGSFVDVYTGRVYPTPQISEIMPAVTADQAIQTSVAHVSGQTRYYTLNAAEQALLHYTGPVSELLIYHKDMKADNARLAWHVTIRPNVIGIWQYFIDARTGSIIHFYNDTRTDGDVPATGTDLNGVVRNFHAYLQGGTYYLVDASKSMFNSSTGEGILQTYNANYSYPGGNSFSASPVTSGGNTWEATAVSAMYNSSAAWDYFKNTFSRNSWNNQGASIPSIIHVGGESGPGYDNAYWNGQAVFYGDGETYFKPLAGGLDVCAHEHGHAFESSGANLEYQGQSGALNETYADIAGAMVERQNWKIGEDVAKPAYFPTGCLRDMSNPHNGGSSFSDMYYQPANVSEMYTGSSDNGGVHVNSGIVNFAYYKTATAITREKAEQIFWRADFHYMTRTAQFTDCRESCLQSAKDLYGDGSTEMQAVATAFDQVGITGSGGGGGGGGGGGAPGTLPENPGQDYIFLYNLTSGDANKLYVSSTDGQSYTPMSQTDCFNRPSILDDGSKALFVSTDHQIRKIMIANPPEESIIQDQQIWDGVAISKKGDLVSAVTSYIDSSIQVYSYQKQEWAKFKLYNPGTETGVKVFNVLYADAMDWDYSGEWIMYDSYSQVKNNQGQSMNYWDVNFIRVWNYEANDWGDGYILKLFTGLPEGVNIGNPSFSKNSTGIAAFDLYDSINGVNKIIAANLNTGNVGTIYNNGSTLGTPNYSKSDNKMIFTTTSQGKDHIAEIALQSDKITPSGNPSVLIQEAMWGIWFTQGTRPFAVEERQGDRTVRLYPNPAGTRVTADIEKLNNEPVQVTVFDLQGKEMMRCSVTSQGSLVPVNLGNLSPGLYMIHFCGNDFSVHAKIMVQ